MMLWYKPGVSQSVAAVNREPEGGGGDESVQYSIQ